MLYLVYSGIQAQGVPYETVKDLTQEKNKTARTIKLTGKVQKGSIDYEPEKPLLKLSVRGMKTDKTIRVVYEGVKPDALRAEGHVILNGRYDPADNTLVANTLLAKCPSRYKSEYDSYSDVKKSSQSTQPDY